MEKVSINNFKDCGEKGLAWIYCFLFIYSFINFKSDIKSNFSF